VRVFGPFLRSAEEADGPAQIQSFFLRHLPSLLIFLLALGLRLLFLYSQHITNPILEHLMMDERMHDLWARSLASGQGLGTNPFFRAPGYYGFLSLLYRIFGASPLVGRLAGCLLGSASVLLVLKLGESLGGRRVGMLAGLLAAGYWPLIYFDIQLLSPSLEIFLNLLMLFLVIQARRRSFLILFFVAGIALGLSAITRPTVLSFAPLLALWVFMSASSRHSSGRRILQVMAVTAGALICVLPVSWINSSHGGGFVLIATNGGVNFYIGNNPESNGMTAVVPGTRKGWKSGYEDTHRIAEEAAGRKLRESEVSSYWYHKALVWISGHPGPWLRLMLLKFRLYWSPHEIGNNQSIWKIASCSTLMRVLRPFGFLLLSSLAVGALFLITGHRGEWWLLGLFAGSSILTTVMFFCNARYRLPVIPILILAVAAGLVQALKFGKSGSWRPLYFALILLLLMAVFVATNPPPTPKFNRDAAANRSLQLAVYYSGATPSFPSDTEKAESCFRETLRLWPGNPEATIGLARILIQSDRTTEAREKLQLLLSHQPENIEAIRVQALCFSRSGETTRAIKTLKKLLSIKPDDAGSLQTLGCLQLAIGSRTEATGNLEKALSLDPHLEQAQIALRRLERDKTRTLPE